MLQYWASTLPSTVHTPSVLIGWEEAVSHFLNGEEHAVRTAQDGEVSVLCAGNMGMVTELSELRGGECRPVTTMVLMSLVR